MNERIRELRDQAFMDTLTNPVLQRLPVDFCMTKRDAEHREYALRFVPGGFSWVEVQLNNPHKEIQNA